MYTRLLVHASLGGPDVHSIIPSVRNGLHTCHHRLRLCLRPLQCMSYSAAERAYTLPGITISPPQHRTLILSIRGSQPDLPVALHVSTVAWRLKSELEADDVVRVDTPLTALWIVPEGVKSVQVPLGLALQALGPPEPITMRLQQLQQLPAAAMEVDEAAATPGAGNAQPAPPTQSPGFKVLTPAAAAAAAANPANVAAAAAALAAAAADAAVVETITFDQLTRDDAANAYVLANILPAVRGLRRPEGNATKPRKAKVVLECGVGGRGGRVALNVFQGCYSQLQLAEPLQGNFPPH